MKSIQLFTRYDGDRGNHIRMRVIKARASEENVLVFGQDSASQCVKAKKAAIVGRFDATKN